MMGQRKSDPQLFNYAVNLEKRVRANHPLRRVKAAIDLSFVGEEVAHCYGKNGNESVAPEVILKMMFLLFFDDIASERELKEVFESLFIRTVAQCVDAGLVDGKKLHVDASLIEADAAKESVIKAAAPLIAALKEAYRATESKLEETSTPA